MPPPQQWPDHTPPIAGGCPRRQTGGRILADRALSRLLMEDRPKTLEDLGDLITRD